MLAGGGRNAAEVIDRTFRFVILRWPAIPEAERYAMEFSRDGETYLPAGSIYAKVCTGGDGFCTMQQDIPPDDPVMYYRVRSIRGPGNGTSAEPSPTVEVKNRPT
jgi:hypothetical protein